LRQGDAAGRRTSEALAVHLLAAGDHTQVVLDVEAAPNQVAQDAGTPYAGVRLLRFALVGPVRDSEAALMRFRVDFDIRLLCLWFVFALRFGNDATVFADFALKLPWWRYFCLLALRFRHDWFGPRNLVLTMLNRNYVMWDLL